jgi:hypothetical protein
LIEPNGQFYGDALAKERSHLLERNQRIGFWRQPMLVVAFTLMAGAAPVLAALASQQRLDHGPGTLCLIAEASDVGGGDQPIRAEGAPNNDKALAQNALEADPSASARPRLAHCTGAGLSTHLPRSGLTRAPPAS